MPWAKGQSGNSKGAPKRCNALARIVREKTLQGEELVLFALSVMRGEALGATSTKDGDTAEVETPSVHDRLDAMKWLADRGWGKAIEHIEIEDASANSISPSDIPLEDLECGLGPTGVVQ
jgi:hypothetical protein